MRETKTAQTGIEEIRQGKLRYGEAISSDDPLVIEKLEAKLECLTKYQEKMKKVNAYYCKNKSIDGCTDLADWEIDSLKATMSRSWHTDPKPYQSYSLTNNNSEIRRLKERIKSIKGSKSQEYSETTGNDGIALIENVEINRLQIIFPDKPDEKTRNFLKSNGFRWSLKEGAWQRQLTDNARYSAERVLKEIRKI